MLVAMTKRTYGPTTFFYLTNKNFTIYKSNFFSKMK